MIIWNIMVSLVLSALLVLFCCITLKEFVELACIIKEEIRNKEENKMQIKAANEIQAH